MEKNPRKMPKTQVNVVCSILFRSVNDRLSTADRVSKRDRYEIIAEILELARGGLTRTHIMYKANLSYAQFNGYYLPILLEKGFLETYMIVRHRKTRMVLKTSEMGEDFIRNFRSLNV